VVVRRRGCRVFWRIGSQMAVRLSAFSAGQASPPGKFLLMRFGVLRSMNITITIFPRCDAVYLQKYETPDSMRT
jgi:hypothetical protein